MNKKFDFLNTLGSLIIFILGGLFLLTFFAPDVASQLISGGLRNVQKVITEVENTNFATTGVQSPQISRQPIPTSVSVQPVVVAQQEQPPAEPVVEPVVQEQGEASTPEPTPIPPPTLEPTPLPPLPTSTPIERRVEEVATAAANLDQVPNMNRSIEIDQSGSIKFVSDRGTFQATQGEFCNVLGSTAAPYTTWQVPPVFDIITWAYLGQQQGDAANAWQNLLRYAGWCPIVIETCNEFLYAAQGNVFFNYEGTLATFPTDEEREAFRNRCQIRGNYKGNAYIGAVVIPLKAMINLDP